MCEGFVEERRARKICTKKSHRDGFTSFNTKRSIIFELTMLLAVHAGAGFQTEANKRNYVNLCKNACSIGLQSLKNGESPVEAVMEAICCLEDHQLTNAGFGSNLCNNGTVELDAALMDGESLNWAAVGAINGVKNPIKVTKLMLEEQDKEQALGLIPPNLLVSDGARRWAVSKGCDPCDNLITESSKTSFFKYKKRLSENANDFSVSKARRLDTVGAVAVDINGKMAAGVSSGGIILKNPGRIGQSAMYGAGIWAEDNVAVSTSGVGEYLTKTLFAKEAAMKIVNSDISLVTERVKKTFNDFVDSPVLKKVKGLKSAGLLAALREDNQIQLIVGHNTPTMCIGYMTDSSPPTAFYSKLPEDSEVCIQAIPLSKISKNSNAP